MSDETTTIDDLDYEQEAQGLAEAAERLAKQHKLDEQTPNEPAVKRYPLYGADHDDTTLELTLLVGPDVTETVSIPWPDDTQDTDEPLVRLAASEGVSLRNITDLETVPVRTDGEEYELVIPPNGDDVASTLFRRAPWLFATTIEDGRFSPSLKARLRPAVLSIGSVGAATLAVLLTTVVLPLQADVLLNLLSPLVWVGVGAVVFALLAVHLLLSAIVRFARMR